MREDTPSAPANVSSMVAGKWCQLVTIVWLASTAAKNKQQALWATAVGRKEHKQRESRHLHDDLDVFGSAWLNIARAGPYTVLLRTCSLDLNKKEFHIIAQQRRTV